MFKRTTGNFFQFVHLGYTKTQVEVRVKGKKINLNFKIYYSKLQQSDCRNSGSLDPSSRGILVQICENRDLGRKMLNLAVNENIKIPYSFSYIFLLILKKMCKFQNKFIPRYENCELKHPIHSTIHN